MSHNNLFNKSLPPFSKEAEITRNKASESWGGNQMTQGDIIQQLKN